MSAWIVSDAHIDALVTFALKEKTSYWTRAGRITFTRESAEEIGRLLLDENIASVNHRYDGRIEDTERDAAAAYRFKPFVPCPAPVTILKACACYDYQASEHDGWDASTAKIIVDAIRMDAIRALPGYDDAPWGITRDAAKPEPDEDAGTITF